MTETPNSPQQPLPHQPAAQQPQPQQPALHQQSPHQQTPHQSAPQQPGAQQLGAQQPQYAAQQPLRQPAPQQHPLQQPAPLQQPQQPQHPYWTGAHPAPPGPLPSAPVPKPPRQRRMVALVAAAALAAGLVGGTAGVLVGSANANSGTVAPLNTSSPTAQVAGNLSSTDVSAIAAKVLPSVVQVNVTTGQGGDIGSGVIMTADGQILTNNHVVSSAANGKLTVTLNDGKTVDATVVGTDPTSDLAVLKAQGVSGLTPATFGDSSQVIVGDQVVAIGSPEGLQGTVTSGVVSALNRDVKVPADQQQSPYQRGSRASGQGVSYKAIQTDASINPGNSGGPLINSKGEVIGINSAIYSPGASNGSAGSIGIGFAIPSNQAKTIAAKLAGK
ncbi:trypsin-like serine protease [Solihabitans fulvus]|uniref:Trypsin-like serine protease n=1 Tax=Solihabitans fulvus TaxID=1892852 RepID=A0A5B2WQM1_9PSEU|nr:trypsin-like peptidase domain-containing protein [Solihabitans fulvus]KAA2254293.1 trypsin-like serine protease [Solihabitans fulvus]